MKNKVRSNKPKNRNGGNFTSSGKSNKKNETTTDSSSHSAKVGFADGGENDGWNDASHLVDVLGLMVRNLSLKNGENKINEKDDLIVDFNGATLHIFRDINSVSEFLPERLPPTNKETGIRGIDNSYHPAIARGVIPNVGRFYVVPGAAANLLSVRELARGNEYELLFKENICTIRHVKYSTIPPLTVHANSSGAYVMKLSHIHYITRLLILAFQAELEENLCFETMHAYPAMNSQPSFT
jgi:hypothetical protein